MHAITRNLVTCAWKACHQPGTHLIPHRSANTVYKLVDQIDRTHEAPVIDIEYCAHHAAAVLELRAETAPAVSDNLIVATA